MRGRVMRRAAALVAVVVLCVATGIADAQEAKKKRPGGKEGGEGGQFNMATIAAQLIQRFDRNGDRSLNLQELSAALTALRQQMEQARGGGDRKRPGQVDPRKKGAGDRKKPAAGEGAAKNKE